MASPDLSGFTDLTLYDKNPQDIFQSALSTLRTRLPTYVAYEGNIDAVLLEEFALESAEASYALNRLPGTIMQVLMQLFGVARYSGAQPTASVTFHLSDATGHVVPAATRVQLDLGDGLDPLTFTTDVPGQALAGATDVTVSVTGEQYTAAANGVATTSGVLVVDSIFFVDSASLASSPVGGVNPETVPDWLARGVTTLKRLNATLVQPQHFTLFALLNPLVTRALTIDDYRAAEPVLTAPTGLTATAAAAGGTFPAASYYWEVTASDDNGETVGSNEATATIVLNGSAVLAWTAVTGAANYTVYRSTVAGGESTSPALVGTVSGTITTPTFTDTGTALTTGSVPATNTTGRAGASSPGYITIAVYGPNGPLTATQKADMQAQMDAAAQANLGISVIDPTVTTVNVTASVKAALGYLAADVQTAVQTALAAYLNVQSWPWSPMVYLNSLLTVIGNVAGVDHVISVTAPAADVALPGIAPLASLGTATITVS